MESVPPQPFTCTSLEKLYHIGTNAHLFLPTHANKSNEQHLDTACNSEPFYRQQLILQQPCGPQGFHKLCYKQHVSPQGFQGGCAVQVVVKAEAAGWASVLPASLLMGHSSLQTPAGQLSIREQLILAIHCAKRWKQIQVIAHSLSKCFLFLLLLRAAFQFSGVATANHRFPF